MELQKLSWADFKPVKESDEPNECDSKLVPASSSSATPNLPGSETTPKVQIKYDWYQTETQIVMEIRIKGLKAKDVKICFEPISLSVTAKLPATLCNEEATKNVVSKWTWLIQW